MAPTSSNEPKVVDEVVIVRDYRHQGLAVFDPQDIASYGRICCWSTLMTMEPGTRPDMQTAAMSWDEVPMSYYQFGDPVRDDDPRLGPFLERYRQWAESCYIEQPVKLVLRRVRKDQEKYRRERWKRR